MPLRIGIVQGRVRDANHQKLGYLPSCMASFQRQIPLLTEPLELASGKLRYSTLANPPGMEGGGGRRSVTRLNPSRGLSSVLHLGFPGTNLKGLCQHPALQTFVACRAKLSYSSLPPPHQPVFHQYFGTKITSKKRAAKLMQDHGLGMLRIAVNWAHQGLEVHTKWYGAVMVGMVANLLAITEWARPVLENQAIHT